MPLVWVYGTLKSGHRNHCVLGAKSVNHGPAVFTFQASAMYDVGFPIIMKGQSRIQVQGELYHVDGATFRRLDVLESNGHMYKRRRKRLPDGRQAWVYIGMDKFWAPQRLVRPVQPDSDGVIRWNPTEWRA